MYTFPNLLKKIREESKLTQAQLANILGVSTVLISMMEVGQKPASKKFVTTLASKLEVHPNTIVPSVFADLPDDSRKSSKLELSLLNLGAKLQNELIRTKAKKLRKYING